MKQNNKTMCKNQKIQPNSICCGILCELIRLCSYYCNQKRIQFSTENRLFEGTDRFYHTKAFVFVLDTLSHQNCGLVKVLADSFIRNFRIYCLNFNSCVSSILCLKYFITTDSLSLSLSSTSVENYLMKLEFHRK